MEPIAGLIITSVFIVPYYTYVIYNTHHDNNISIPVVVDLNWYFPNAIAYNHIIHM